MHVELGRTAQRELTRLASKLQERILERLKKLRAEPVPAEAKFLGRDEDGDRVFRLRTGKYRVLYTLTEETILVFRIRRRDKAYEKRR